MINRDTGIKGEGMIKTFEQWHKELFGWGATGNVSCFSTDALIEYDKRQAAYDAGQSASAARIEAAENEEAERWANRLDWLHTKYGSDCSGVDSGDLLDCVEVEIKQALNKQAELEAKVLAEQETTAYHMEVFRQKEERIAELECQLSRIDKESEFQARELNNRKTIIAELQADCKAMAEYISNGDHCLSILCTCPACLIAAKYREA